MNKVKIALASLVVAGSMVAAAAPAMAAPVSQDQINVCKNISVTNPNGTVNKTLVRARLNCFMGLLSIKYPNILNIGR